MTRLSTVARSDAHTHTHNNTHTAHTTWPFSRIVAHPGVLHYVHRLCGPLWNRRGGFVMRADVRCLPVCEQPFQASVSTHRLAWGTFPVLNDGFLIRKPCLAAEFRSSCVLFGEVFEVPLVPRGQLVEDVLCGGYHDGDLAVACGSTGDSKGSRSGCCRGKYGEPAERRKHRRVPARAPSDRSTARGGSSQERLYTGPDRA